MLSPNKEQIGEVSSTSATSEITNKTVAPSILSKANNNAAIASMVGELMEFRKGTASQNYQLQASNKKNEELEMTNMQLMQQNQILQKQLQQIHSGQSKQTQLTNMYGGSKQSKPKNEQEALQLLNTMMQKRINSKK